MLFKFNSEIDICVIFIYIHVENCSTNPVQSITCIELSAKVGNQSKEPCQLPEFQSVCRHYLGPWGEYAALLAADVIVVGALTVYYVLLSKFMFGAGMSIYQLR